MEEIKNIIEKILKYLSIENAEIKIWESDDSIKANIKVDYAGWLIGKEGANLKDLEYIFNLLVRKIMDDPSKRASLDVNNYKKIQEEKLIQAAKEAAHRVLVTKKPVRLPGLNSYERMIIHNGLSINPNIITESEGEKENRCLIIKPYP